MRTVSGAHHINARQLREFLKCDGIVFRCIQIALLVDFRKQHKKNLLLITRQRILRLLNQFIALCDVGAERWLSRILSQQRSGLCRSLFLTHDLADNDFGILVLYDIIISFLHGIARDSVFSSLSLSTRIWSASYLWCAILWNGYTYDIINHFTLYDRKSQRR